MKLSKLNGRITTEYLSEEPENLYFERKKAKVDSKDLANEIASFANANGGVIVVGVTDNGEIEGFNSVGVGKLNECQKVVVSHLKTTPIYKCEVVDVTNSKNEKDNIVLFHIEPSLNTIIRNNKDEVYIRQGDSTIKLTQEQVDNLLFDRKERDFESKVIFNSTINDIDYEMANLYKEKLQTDLSCEEVLKARGFLVKYGNELHLTNAGMLLFGKNPTIYFPSARVRVLKFEGNNFQVGKDMNIIKDKTFDYCLYKTIIKASEFISTQLREFTHLNDKGIFETVPEYPEFAWYEGLVNAVTHRDYSNSGEHTTIKIFDDRMEICSPGGLGGFVTISTLTKDRYSRNPQISRVLSEFGVVRELNEGIKRIYREMKQFFLKEPEFSDMDHHHFLMTLDNNIVMRSKRTEEGMLKNKEVSEIWDTLKLPEKKVLKAIYDKGGITASEVSEIIDRGRTTSVKMLNKLIEMNLIEYDGTSSRDPYGKYVYKN